MTQDNKTNEEHISVFNRVADVIREGGEAFSKELPATTGAMQGVITVGLFGSVFAMHDPTLFVEYTKLMLGITAVAAAMGYGMDYVRETISLGIEVVEKAREIKAQDLKSK